MAERGPNGEYLSYDDWYNAWLQAYEEAQTAKSEMDEARNNVLETFNELQAAEAAAKDTAGKSKSEVDALCEAVDKAFENYQEAVKAWFESIDKWSDASEDEQYMFSLKPEILAPLPLGPGY